MDTLDNYSRILFCAKANTLFFKVTLKSNIWLIVSRNVLSLMWFVSVENRSIVGQLWVSSENCLHYVYLAGCTCVCCDRIFGIENTELIVTYAEENKL